MARDRTLVETLERTYARAGQQGRPLNWHEKLTSVWRPNYAPFAELLEWVPEGASILDIGCGSGAFLFLCQELRNARAGVGIDANPRSIALAELVSASPALAFRVGLEVPTDLVAAADVISMIDVLHHVPKEAKDGFLRPILASARPGCRILIKDLDPSPAWMAMANRMTDYLSTRSIVDYLSRDDVKRRLRTAGLDVVASRDLRKHVWSHFLVVGQKT